MARDFRTPAAQSLPPGAEPARAPTGITELDDVLGGGLPRNRLYLVEGDPGAGKTTLGLQFLLEGVKQGETGLYFTFSETKDELLSVAVSHGWSLEGIHIYELSAAEQFSRADSEQTVFHSGEVELPELAKLLLKEVDRLHPSRVVFDSLSEIRLLAGNLLRFRRQILGLKSYFAGRKCTVLLLDDRQAGVDDSPVRSLAHGVIDLEQLSPAFGADRRRLRVVKVRGIPYRAGYHDFAIRTGGLEVYPRLVAADHRQDGTPEQLTTGIAELDNLLEGGFDRGTGVLLMGPAGSGKSSVAAMCVAAAAARGQCAAVYLFEERLRTFHERAARLGIGLGQCVEQGRLRLQQVDPAELSPGEFAHIVRRSVEEAGTELVVIDSLTGYYNAMSGEHFLPQHLHELLTYLGQRHVTTLLVLGQHGLFHATAPADVDISYLADTVLLFRYYEYGGEVRKAVSVFKRRSGGHERTLRELKFGAGGISIGPPLREFRGVLTGVPEFDPQVNSHPHP